MHYNVNYRFGVKAMYEKAKNIWKISISFPLDFTGKVKML